MQKSKTAYRIIALFMAVLMFITSVGFNVDLHFCSGEFKSFSLVGKAKSCHDKSMFACPHHQKMMTEKNTDQVDTNNCCSNKLVHIQSDQDKVQQTLDFVKNPELQTFITSFVATFFSIYQVEAEPTIFHKYRPPSIARDIPVLIQSFLL